MFPFKAVPFELDMVRKYLIPRKKHLSISLIALLSVGVISLVVWLLLLFLSVTEGIEKGWLKKLTSLNAPLKLTPTQRYYNSYYYHIDRYAAASNYAEKSIGEKLVAEMSDPYVPEEDLELPDALPMADRNEKGEMKDPVKGAWEVLSALKERRPDTAFQDYELTGALMRLKLLRPRSGLLTLPQDRQESVLTQVSYLATAARKSPYMASLILPPSAEELNHYLYLANQSADFNKRCRPLFAHAAVTQMKSARGHLPLSLAALQGKGTFDVQATLDEGRISYLEIAENKEGATGKLFWDKRGVVYKDRAGEVLLSEKTPLFVLTKEPFAVCIVEESLQRAHSLDQIEWDATWNIQGKRLSERLHFDGLLIAKADVQTRFTKTPTSTPPWAHFVQEELILPPDPQGESGILLPKNYQEMGVKSGDTGYFAFGAQTASSVQEQQIPFVVAGFYDPGILAVGSRCALASSSVVRALSAASTFTPVDRSLANGIQVWIADLGDVKLVQRALQEELAAKGIDGYWSVSTFHDYDFAKDLMQQFASDRTLFLLIGIIILIVGCSNIISLLVLLVSTKRKEIGMLLAMGATKKSIAAIFGLLGATMGACSALLGSAAALLTLRHIDAVVRALSWMQGREAFNALFYGSSLPNTLSLGATEFILIATPILALLAGLIPAIYACRMQPSAILREQV